MIILLLMGQLAWAPPTPAPAQVVEVRPRIVLLKLPYCDACEVALRELRSLALDDRIDFYIEDLEAWNARTGEGLQASIAPTVFAWKDPTKAGLKLEHKSITDARVRRALFPEEAPPPKPAPVASKPPARNYHTVGDFDGNRRITANDYRIHLRQTHGYSQAQVNAMTLGELQRAHESAHAGVGYPSRNYTRRRSR